MNFTKSFVSGIGSILFNLILAGCSVNSETDAFTRDTEMFGQEASSKSSAGNALGHWISGL